MIHLTNFCDGTICNIATKDLNPDEILSKNIFEVNCEHCIRIISRDLTQEMDIYTRRLLNE